MTSVDAETIRRTLPRSPRSPSWAATPRGRTRTVGARRGFPCGPRTPRPRRRAATRALVAWRCWAPCRRSASSRRVKVRSGRGTTMGLAPEPPVTRRADRGRRPSSRADIFRSRASRASKCSSARGARSRSCPARAGGSARSPTTARTSPSRTARPRSRSRTNRAHRWLVEAGPFLVTVKGTVFTVSWDPGERAVRAAASTRPRRGERSGRQRRHRVAGWPAPGGEPAAGGDRDHRRTTRDGRRCAGSAAPAVDVTAAGAARTAVANGRSPAASGARPRPHRQRRATRARRWAAELARGYWDRILADVDRDGVDATLENACQRRPVRARRRGPISTAQADLSRAALAGAAASLSPRAALARRALPARAGGGSCASTGPRRRRSPGTTNTWPRRRGAPTPPRRWDGR